MKKMFVRAGALCLGFLAVSACAQSVPLAEFAATVHCPESGAPDVAPGVFAGLPENFRNWVESQDEPFRTQVVCGQYLNDLLADRYGVISHSTASAALRSIGLSDMQSLLAIGQVPRTADGRSNWNEAAGLLLKNSRQPDQHLRPVAPRQQRRLQGRQGEARGDVELHAAHVELFKTRLLPRIALETPEDARLFVDLLGELITRDDLPVLSLLQAFEQRGLLAKTLAPQSETSWQAGWLLKTAAGPQVSEAVFDFLSARIALADEAEAELLQTALQSWNPTALARLLRRGRGPVGEGLFELANQEQQPELHALLAAEAERRKLAVIPPYVSRERLLPGVESSYRCHPEQGTVTRVEGEGTHGCYFILRDPENGQPLPETRYRLVAETRRANGFADRTLAANGFTDAQGRTPFLLLEPDIEMRASQFVPVVGDGQSEFELTYTPNTDAPASGPLPRYEILTCNGKPAYRGRFDGFGKGVIYFSAARCQPRVRIVREEKAK